MATVVGEAERKYEPGDAGVAAISGLEDVGRLTGPTEMEIDNSYLDTADLRLAAAGVTLRRRSGGGESGWQLKLPAGAGTPPGGGAASGGGGGVPPPPRGNAP